MTERRKQVEQFRDLAWFIELLNQNFELLAEIRGYTEEQFRKLEDALNQLVPVSDGLDDLLVNLRSSPKRIKPLYSCCPFTPVLDKSTIWCRVPG